MTRARIGLAAVTIAAVCGSLSLSAQAKVSASEADRLGKDLMPLGGEKAGNADGSIPAWDGGMNIEVKLDGTQRHSETYKDVGGADKPLYVITADNMDQYAELLTPGMKAMFKQYPETFKMPVYPSRRTALAPDFVYAATKRNAVNAELANGGESLVNAVTGIPFPIPQSGKEVIWNHKTRYRGQSVTRYNTQLAVQTSGSFVPYKLREDVYFSYSQDGIKTEDLNNVIVYFLQVTTAPPRQAGQVLLVHETMDQVAEARRAWLYNPGQRRTRRAPNVAYDNPGTGADGLRTNDQLDMFNGATDRYNWKLVGKREMLVPYNAHKLSDSRLKYEDMTMVGHLNPEHTRYEKHRVWVLDSEVKDDTSHLYKRRTFYVDEDSWTALQADIYDNRDNLWRVQEYHQVTVPWTKAVGPAAGTVYDLQSGRYLVMECSNEEPEFSTKSFGEEHFRTSNMPRVAANIR
ncbi:hypothetical protein ATO7_14863 [Oceanococcus atlanticus]|uniref:Outer membrane lipoprotein-sorting protein n=1 Tax=Oceanococcus atlanticus TaxID=1317117 RepID=A0A1Y1SBM6_9GAMM|nr:DUF1329 domain-containing protein [Oceanococcus atlanticus]ORE85513.1 hypothetical protein ATO7_14863 [Oceanococcus atlanticus]RZO84646.1 MAG: DUF1329 domain-containing protein [Oceanococcus sp.]